MAYSDTEIAVFDASWEPNMVANLVFLTRDGREVLLIHKKTGLGAGKLNGPGGKLEDGETPLQAAVREVEEELQITPTDLERRGELHFHFADGLKLFCTVFTGEHFTGTPTETREAKPEWFAYDAVPYDRMWEDPQMLLGESFRAWFCFDGEAMMKREVRFGDLPDE